jgi:hypothetical protein
MTRTEQQSNPCRCFIAIPDTTTSLHICMVITDCATAYTEGWKKPPHPFAYKWWTRIIVKKNNPDLRSILINRCYDMCQFLIVTELIVVSEPAVARSSEGNGKENVECY